MTEGRFVILGLARARRPWFTTLARWATTAALPLEYVACLSVEEVRARLTSGRAFSALVADAAVPGLDLDLISRAQSAGLAVVVVDNDPPTRDWIDLGCDAILTPDFDRRELIDALESSAPRIDDVHPLGAAEPNPIRPWRGAMVTVVGGHGAGVSTVAIAAAQALAKEPRFAGSVALADLAPSADLGCLHDAADVVPGLPELVDSHRRGALPAAEVRAMLHEVPERGYDLLLGLRRRREWSLLRPRAVATALDGLRGSYRVVVCDVEPDLDGERETGSIELEERNTPAREAVRSADVVLAVGAPDIKGVRNLIRTLHDLFEFGVAPARVLPVVNRAPRSPRARAELSEAVAALVQSLPVAADGLANPLFLPARRRLDDAYRDGAPLPSALVDLLRRPIVRMLDTDSPQSAEAEPVLVRPGELGLLAEHETATS